MPKTDTRQQFEEWAKPTGLEATRWASGEYASAYTEMAWDAWQAATKRAARIAENHPVSLLIGRPTYQAAIAAAIRGGSDAKD